MPDVPRVFEKEGSKCCNPLFFLAALKLRFLCPSDLPEVKTLCCQWFPIEYPDVWYEDITANPRFYALAATYHSAIIGLLVAETKILSKINKEDQDILPSTFFLGSHQIGYILTLGVIESQRGNGIASLLLDNYMKYIKTHESETIQVVLLHVLTTNECAIQFYQKRGFVRHTFLPYYYNIKGKSKDGFSYVRYINGGHPPWTLLDYIHQYASQLYLTDWCWWPARIIARFWSIVSQSASATVAQILS